MNNIIAAHHVAAEGRLPIKSEKAQFSYRAKLTYSRNYGRLTNCADDFCQAENNPLLTGRRDQWYSFLEVMAQLSDQLQLNVSTAFDTGQVANRFGFNAGARYAF